MSRMVSIRLPTVHSPTIAPSHRNRPVRAASTSRIGPASVAATRGGIVASTTDSASSPSLVRPNALITAVAVMKNGNNAISAI